MAQAVQKAKCHTSLRSKILLMYCQLTSSALPGRLALFFDIFSAYNNTTTTVQRFAKPGKIFILWHDGQHCNINDYFPAKKAITVLSLEAPPTYYWWVRKFNKVEIRHEAWLVFVRQAKYADIEDMHFTLAFAAYLIQDAKATDK